MASLIRVGPDSKLCAAYVADVIDEALTPPGADAPPPIAPRTVSRPFRQVLWNH